MQITEALDHVAYMIILATPEALRCDMVRKERRYHNSITKRRPLMLVARRCVLRERVRVVEALATNSQSSQSVAAKLGTLIREFHLQFPEATSHQPIVPQVAGSSPAAATNPKESKHNIYWIVAVCGRTTIHCPIVAHYLSLKFCHRSLGI